MYLFSFHWVKLHGLVRAQGLQLVLNDTLFCDSLYLFETIIHEKIKNGQGDGWRQHDGTGVVSELRIVFYTTDSLYLHEVFNRFLYLHIFIGGNLCTFIRFDCNFIRLPCLGHVTPLYLHQVAVVEANRDEHDLAELIEHFVVSIRIRQSGPVGWTMDANFQGRKEKQKRRNRKNTNWGNKLNWRKQNTVKKIMYTCKGKTKQPSMFDSPVQRCNLKSQYMLRQRPIQLLTCCICPRILCTFLPCSKQLMDRRI